MPLCKHPLQQKQQAEAGKAQHPDHQGVEHVQAQVQPGNGAAQEPQGAEAQGRVARYPEYRFQGAFRQTQHPQQDKQRPHAQGGFF